MFRYCRTKWPKSWNFLLHTCLWLCKHLGINGILCIFVPWGHVCALSAHCLPTELTFTPCLLVPFSIWPQPCMLLLQATEETRRENDSHQDQSKWGERTGLSLAKGSLPLCRTSGLLFNIKHALQGRLYGIYFHRKATERAFALVIGVEQGCVAVSWLSKALECGAVRSISSVNSWGCYRFVALWSAFNMSARGGWGTQRVVWFASLTDWD